MQNRCILKKLLSWWHNGQHKQIFSTGVFLTSDMLCLPVEYFGANSRVHSVQVVVFCGKIFHMCIGNKYFRVVFSPNPNVNHFIRKGKQNARQLFTTNICYKCTATVQKNIK